MYGQAWPIQCTESAATACVHENSPNPPVLAQFILLITNGHLPKIFWSFDGIFCRFWAHFKQNLKKKKKKKKKKNQKFISAMCKIALWWYLHKWLDISGCLCWCLHIWGQRSLKGHYLKIMISENASFLSQITWNHDVTDTHAWPVTSCDLFTWSVIDRFVIGGHLRVI